jgi:ubiquinone/menaquinone biosynthesis C-methylase UbiE/uncharacterized protein YbaR (Trm112 family)
MHVFQQASGSLCREGVLACEGCGRWFAISDYMLELLPDALSRRDARHDFWHRHRARLGELGLGDPAAAPSAQTEEFEVQARQTRYFDDLASRSDEFSYEHFMGTAFWRAQDARMFTRWLPQIDSSSLVLDVGCGDGRTTFRLAGADRVVAFDLSSNQVRRAVQRARDLGLLARFTFFVGDASSFPVADRSVDSVLMDGVLHHVPDPAQTLREAGRVLKEGGRYFGKENNRTPLRPLFDLLQRVRPLWHEEAGPEQVISPGRLRRWAADAGMTVSVEPQVYLPPHFFGRVDERRARRVLDATDRFFRRVPLVRRWGGLLVIEGRKGPAAAK